MTESTDSPTILWFENLGRGDTGTVGGKNASLGEMVQALAPKGIAVPPGFATSADAFRRFLSENELEPVIGDYLARLEDGRMSLAEAGAAIRKAIVGGEWPEDMRQAILDAYAELGRRAGIDEPSVAVRSSATAEDLPEASFAGQQETFLNVRGKQALLSTCRRCFASLYTDRAITYRRVQGFAHEQVALSVGVQMMVRADIGGAGVMFTLDTESGFDKVVLINAAWGLGEVVVQGTVSPDEYQVFKPLLEKAGTSPIVQKKRGAKERKMVYAGAEGGETRMVPTSRAERAAWVLEDDEILGLARQAVVIEDHYGQPMDIEWARDGETGKLWIVQARPETVQSRRAAGKVMHFTLHEHGRELLRGLSVGDAVVSAPVCLIEHAADIERFIDGAILVTPTTDPDWVPIMKRAAAIVTDHGGRTSHAAIVSRELGLPAIVGCGNATELLHDEQMVTVSCAGGDEGVVYEGKARFSAEEIDLSSAPETRTRVMLNMANPAAAFRWWRLPADGVGLARMEFVISNAIRVHPLALTRFDSLRDEKVKAEIEEITKGYDSKPDYFVDQLARGLARIAAMVWPKPVIVRMSDFKTNEYAGLIGGAGFEPGEENPMIGWRGASRYHDKDYAEGFALECRAIRRLREEMGFDNVVVMIPFCRTPEEGDRVLATMKEAGLERGKDGLKVYVMVEIPSNVIRAEEFARRFDGFSIGSNDLTQLTLGVDRDSGRLAALFAEDDPAVLWMIREAISRGHAAGVPVGLCGQAPSNDPKFARLLVEAGIDSISVTPDSFLQVKENVAQAEGAGRPSVAGVVARGEGGV
ncbi:MAG: phosphoenolpyruvate synthase [Pararhodobacter sp.]|nr:phosphoenolpyruvate synthase [Pararhodobacter sp.]